MDTSGRTVLGTGGGQEQAKQMFGKVGEGGRQDAGAACACRAAAADDTINLPKLPARQSI